MMPPWLTARTSPWPPERRQDSHEHGFVVLPAGRPFALVEHAGELRIDLRSRETGELAGVAFFQTRIDDHGPDAECGGDDRGGVECPLEVARKDGMEGARLVRGAAGLGTAELGERWVGLALPAPDRVPLRLAMPDEEEIQHVALTVTRPSDGVGGCPPVEIRACWRHGSTPLVRLRP